MDSIGLLASGSDSASNRLDAGDCSQTSKSALKIAAQDLLCGEAFEPVARGRTAQIFFNAINLTMVPDDGLLSSDGAETIRKAQRPLEYLRGGIDWPAIR